VSQQQRVIDLEAARGEVFDVAIIGGGVNGACLFNHLGRMGYRVLLVDKGDFGGGSSQASAMMVWGGLLYLKNFDVATVARFSRDRDAMIRDLGCQVSPSSFRYVPSRVGRMKKQVTILGLYLYWILGLFRQQRPRFEGSYREKEFLGNPRHDGSFLYQEAVLNGSDSRFVLGWIAGRNSHGGIALNYCGLDTAQFHRGDKCWRLQVVDRIDGRSLEARSRCIVNCSGVWTDAVNRQCGIKTPYKHVYSKGVFIGFERESWHNSPLIFDTTEDVLSLIPWGPVSLWGPTETSLSTIENGINPEPEDVNFLLEWADRHLKRKIRASDVVSLRCGVRPLVVEKNYSENRYPLELSRRHRIVRDPEKPWISVYGGKFTSCVSVAQKTAEQIKKLAPRRRNPFAAPPDAAADPTEWEAFPGLRRQVPSVKWCIERERCVKIEDYLRRRTNISQWAPRGGLGKNGENIRHLERLALHFADGDSSRAGSMIRDYRRDVERRFDAVLAEVK
jgi:glycerol-3-phosphate dehydrogenase